MLKKCVISQIDQKNQLTKCQQIFFGLVLSFFVFNSSGIDADEQSFGTESEDDENVIGEDENETNFNETNNGEENNESVGDNETDDEGDVVEIPFSWMDVYKTTQNDYALSWYW